MAVISGSSYTTLPFKSDQAFDTSIESILSPLLLIGVEWKLRNFEMSARCSMSVFPVSVSLFLLARMGVPPGDRLRLVRLRIVCPRDDISFSSKLLSSLAGSSNDGSCASLVGSLSRGFPSMGETSFLRDFPSVSVACCGPTNCPVPVAVCLVTVSCGGSGGGKGGVECDPVSVIACDPVSVVACFSLVRIVVFLKSNTSLVTVFDGIFSGDPPPSIRSSSSATTSTGRVLIEGACLLLSGLAISSLRGLRWVSLSPRFLGLAGSGGCGVVGRGCSKGQYAAPSVECRDRRVVIRD